MKKIGAFVIFAVLYYILLSPFSVYAQFRSLPTAVPNTNRVITLPTATPTLVTRQINTPTPTTTIVSVPMRTLLTPTLVPSLILRARPSITPTPFPTLSQMLQTRLASGSGQKTLTLSHTRVIDADAITGRLSLDGNIEEDPASESGRRIQPDYRILLTDQSGSPSGSLRLTVKPNGLDIGFMYAGDEIVIPSDVSLRFREGLSIALIDKLELPLKLSPPAFYASIRAAAGNLQADIGNVRLTTKNRKPVYEIETTKQVKLLGFLPYVAKMLLEIDATNNSITKISRSPLLILSPGIDWAKAIAIGPNLEIRNVRMYKQSYHAGDTARIVFDLVNTGTESYLPYGKYITNTWRSGEKAVYSRLENPFLDPGASRTYDYYTWTGYECDKPMSIEVDLSNAMKETTKSDNIWQGVSVCAPEHGPDIAVMSITPVGFGGEKVIGKKQSVLYVLKNIGDTPSVPTRALMRTLGGKYIALQNIPAIEPGSGYITNADYTPDDCSLVELMVDTDKKNIEINEDNNYGTEDPVIETHCKNRPDLTVDWVYWMFNGYSFGKPNPGGTMNFEVRLANSSTDHDFGCAPNVTLGVYQDGGGILNIPYGDIGSNGKECLGGGVAGSYDYPLYISSKKFNYNAVCGVELKFIADQENMIAESDETNNVQTVQIECQ